MKVTSSLPAKDGANIYSVNGNVKEKYFDPAGHENQRTLVRAAPLRQEQTKSSENIIDVYEKRSLDLIAKQQDEEDNRKPFLDQLPAFPKLQDSAVQGQIAQKLSAQEFAKIGVDSYIRTAGLPVQRAQSFSKGSIVDLWA